MSHLVASCTRRSSRVQSCSDYEHGCKTPNGIWQDKEAETFPSTKVVMKPMQPRTLALLVQA